MAGRWPESAPPGPITVLVFPGHENALRNWLFVQDALPRFWIWYWPLAKKGAVLGGGAGAGGSGGGGGGAGGVELLPPTFQTAKLLVTVVTNCRAVLPEAQLGAATYVAHPVRPDTTWIVNPFSTGTNVNCCRPDWSSCKDRRVTRLSNIDDSLRQRDLGRCLRRQRCRESWRGSQGSSCTVSTAPTGSAPAVGRCWGSERCSVD